MSNQTSRLQFETNTESLHSRTSSLKNRHRGESTGFLPMKCRDWCWIDVISFFPVQFTPFITRTSWGHIPNLLSGIQILKDSSQKGILWCVGIGEGLGIQVNSPQARIFFSTGVLFRATCVRWCQISYHFLILIQSHQRALESSEVDTWDLADACSLRVYSSFGEVQKLLQFLKENTLEDWICLQI